MDVKKELAEMNQNNSNSPRIINDLTSQIEELQKKRYLITIVSFVNKVVELIESGIFKDNNICFMDINIDYSLPATNALTITFIDSDREALEKYDPNRSLACDTAMDSVEHIVKDIAHANQFRSDFLSEQFSKDEGDTFRLKKGIGKKILYALLSKELHAILDYSEMDNDLSQPSHGSKKLKL